MTIQSYVIAKTKVNKRLNNPHTGTRLKASSISSFVRPFFSRNDLLKMTGEPLTFGCERNFTAFCTCSSRIGSEFTNTEGVGFRLEASAPDSRIGSEFTNTDGVDFGLEASAPDAC
jgi:hypothetical protein